MGFSESLAAIVLAAAAAASPDTARIQEVKAHALPTLGPYSQAIASNGFLFISGVLAFDPAKNGFASPDIESQTRQALRNLDAILQAAGLTSKSVVKTTVFIKDPKDLPVMNKVWLESFKEPRPARTTAPGIDWGRPDILIEIDAIAAYGTASPAQPSR